MIAFVRGRIAVREPSRVVIDVGGVGYEVEVPMSTFCALPERGREVELLTHLVVREDAHLLFGFATEEERRLFRSLVRVTGVGARMALAILSGISVPGFVECVEREDSAALTRLPGIGKKTAQRLIVEMRDRIRETRAAALPVAVESGGSQPEREAYSALLALGYKAPEAARMLRSVDAAGLDAAQIIRLALRGSGAAAEAERAG